MTCKCDSGRLIPALCYRNTHSHAAHRVSCLSIVQQTGLCGRSWYSLTSTLATRRPLTHNGASLLVTAHMDQFRNDTLTLQVRAGLRRKPVCT